MNKENNSTRIGSEDLSFLKEEFSKTKQPVSLEDMVKNLAYQKNKDQLSQQVKIYDPYSQYAAGDLILKTYDELLTVSSKGAEHFKGSVVLKIINKINYDDFQCEMLEVDFSGGGPFRKHIDYMKKTNTQVMLPSNLENKAASPEVLKKEDDPRLTELPMHEKDLRTLEKNLQVALSKSVDFFCWNRHWQLISNKIDIKKVQVKTLQKQFKKENRSYATEEMVSSLFDIPRSNKLFDLHCMSLNHSLECDFKKDFVFVAPDGWGRWHLKDTLESFFKGLPISAKKAKVPNLDDIKKHQPAQPLSSSLKLYLSWREISSGALKVPKNFNKELIQSREYIFSDTEGKKDYTVYYYPSSLIFLGLKDFYESNHIPQGANLTLIRTGTHHFSLTVKKSKKKLNVPNVTYSQKNDAFSLNKEQSTYCMPNKIVYIEMETLEKLFSFYDQRNKRDLRELLIMVFKQFGLEGEYLFMHSLRAFHLVDTLRNTYQEDVEKVLLSSPEFSKSEKKKGIFMYMEKVKTEEEAPGRKPTEVEEAIPDQKKTPLPADSLPEIGTIEDEMPAQELKEDESELKIVEVIEEKPVEEEPTEPEFPEITPEERQVEAKSAKPKKAKEAKKKERAPKIEQEKETRKRKGAKRIREEQLEIEESEMEALFAVKAKEKEDVAEIEKEKPSKPEKEEYEQLPQEEPKFGLFAEKLKSALGEKQKTKKKAVKKPPPKKTK